MFIYPGVYLSLKINFAEKSSSGAFNFKRKSPFFYFKRVTSNPSSFLNMISLVM